MYIKAVNTSYFLGRFEETQYLSIKNIQGKQEVFHLVKYMYGQSQGRLLEVMKLPHLLQAMIVFLWEKKKHRKAPTFRQITFCKSIFAVQKMLFGQ